MADCSPAGPAHQQHHHRDDHLSGCYLLIVVGEPISVEHRDVILQKISKGFLSWDIEATGCCVSAELQYLVDQAPLPEEAKNGEKLIQFVSENLVTEVLINPQANTLQQCMKNLLSSYTKHKHVIHSGYAFTESGSWILQDSTYSFADFIDAFQDSEVQRIFKAYENCISIHVHCAPEGDWNATRMAKEPLAKLVKIGINPDDRLTNLHGVTNFVNFIGNYIIAQPLEQLLEPSDVVGNIRFSRPTLYIFPGGQGDSALFGVNGFNMLIDGGFNRKACFWDFARHLDRVDALLVTRVTNSNMNGVSSFLKRKVMGQVYPKIGHVFSNILDRKHSPDGDKDTDHLLISIAEEGQLMMENLRHLGLKPQNCYRESTIEAINLYHKVGHGKLDMYVLNPAKDSREVKEFLQQWHSQSSVFGTSKVSMKIGDKEMLFPLPTLMSICAILVWQPADPTDSITRILFPGSSPQTKIFEGLDRLRHLEMLRAPVCSAQSLQITSVTKMKSKMNIGDVKPIRLSAPKLTTVHKQDDKISQPSAQPHHKIDPQQPLKHEPKAPQKSEEKKPAESKITSSKSSEDRKSDTPARPLPKPDMVKSDGKKAENKRPVSTVAASTTVEKKSEPRKVQVIGGKVIDVGKSATNGSSARSSTTSKHATTDNSRSTPKAKGLKEANNKKVVEEKNIATKASAAASARKESSGSIAKKKVIRKTTASAGVSTVGAPIEAAAVVAVAAGAAAIVAAAASKSPSETGSPTPSIGSENKRPESPAAIYIPSTAELDLVSGTTIESPPVMEEMSPLEENVEIDTHLAQDSAEEERASVDEKQSLDEEMQAEKDKIPEKSNDFEFNLSNDILEQGEDGSFNNDVLESQKVQSVECLKENLDNDDFKEKDDYLHQEADESLQQPKEDGGEDIVHPEKDESEERQIDIEVENKGRIEKQEAAIEVQTEKEVVDTQDVGEVETVQSHISVDEEQTILPIQAQSLVQAISNEDLEILKSQTAHEEMAQQDIQIVESTTSNLTDKIIDLESLSKTGSGIEDDVGYQSLQTDDHILADEATAVPELVKDQLDEITTKFPEPEFQDTKSSGNVDDMLEKSDDHKDIEKHVADSKPCKEDEFIYNKEDAPSVNDELEQEKEHESSEDDNDELNLALQKQLDISEKNQKEDLAQKDNDMPEFENPKLDDSPGKIEVITSDDRKISEEIQDVSQLQKDEDSTQKEYESPEKQLIQKDEDSTQKEYESPEKQLIQKDEELTQKEYESPEKELTQKDEELTQKEYESPEKEPTQKDEELTQKEYESLKKELTQKDEELTQKKYESPEKELTQKDEELTQKELIQKEELTQKEYESPEKEHELIQKEKELTQKEYESHQKEQELIKKDDLMLKENELMQKENELINSEDKQILKEDELILKEDALIQKEGEIIQKDDDLIHEEDDLIQKDSALNQDSVQEDRDLALNSRKSVEVKYEEQHASFLVDENVNDHDQTFKHGLSDEFQSQKIGDSQPDEVIAMTDDSKTSLDGHHADHGVTIEGVSFIDSSKTSLEIEYFDENEIACKEKPTYSYSASDQTDIETTESKSFKEKNVIEAGVEKIISQDKDVEIIQDSSYHESSTTEYGEKEKPSILGISSDIDDNSIASIPKENKNNENFDSSIPSEIDNEFVTKNQSQPTEVELKEEMISVITFPLSEKEFTTGDAMNKDKVEQTMYSHSDEYLTDDMKQEEIKIKPFQVSTGSEIIQKPEIQESEIISTAQAIVPDFIPCESEQHLTHKEKALASTYSPLLHETIDDYEPPTVEQGKNDNESTDNEIRMSDQFLEQSTDAVQSTIAPDLNKIYEKEILEVENINKEMEEKKSYTLAEAKEIVDQVVRTSQDIVQKELLEDTRLSKSPEEGIRAAKQESPLLEQGKLDEQINADAQAPVQITQISSTSEKLMEENVTPMATVEKPADHGRISLCDETGQRLVPENDFKTGIILSPIPEDAPKLSKIADMSSQPPHMEFHRETVPPQQSQEFLRTPDEVADLPIHEEVPSEFGGYYHIRSPLDRIPEARTEPEEMSSSGQEHSIEKQADDIHQEVAVGEPVFVGTLNADHAEVVTLSNDTSPSTPLSPKSPKAKDKGEGGFSVPSKEPSFGQLPVDVKPLKDKTDVTEKYIDPIKFEMEPISKEPEIFETRSSDLSLPLKDKNIPAAAEDKKADNDATGSTSMLHKSDELTTEPDIVPKTSDTLTKTDNIGASAADNLLIQVTTVHHKLDDVSTKNEESSKQSEFDNAQRQEENAENKFAISQTQLHELGVDFHETSQGEKEGNRGSQAGIDLIPDFLQETNLNQTEKEDLCNLHKVEDSQAAIEVSPESVLFISKPIDPMMQSFYDETTATKDEKPISLEDEIKRGSKEYSFLSEIDGSEYMSQDRAEKYSSCVTDEPQISESHQYNLDKMPPTTESHVHDAKAMDDFASTHTRFEEQKHPTNSPPDIIDIERSRGGLDSNIADQSHKSDEHQTVVLDKDKEVLAEIVSQTTPLASGHDKNIKTSIPQTDDREYEGYYEVHDPTAYEFLHPTPLADKRRSLTDLQDEFDNMPAQTELDIISNMKKQVPISPPPETSYETKELDKESIADSTKLSHKELTSQDDEKDTEEVLVKQSQPEITSSFSHHFSSRSSDNGSPLPVEYLPSSSGSVNEPIEHESSRKRAETFLEEQYESSLPSTQVHESSKRPINPLEQSYHSEYSQHSFYGDTYDPPAPQHSYMTESSNVEALDNRNLQNIRDPREQLKSLPDVTQSPIHSGSYVSADDDTEDEYRGRHYEDKQSDVDSESPYHRPDHSALPSQGIRERLAYQQRNLEAGGRDSTSDDSDVEMSRQQHGRPSDRYYDPNEHQRQREKTGSHGNGAGSYSERFGGEQSGRWEHDLQHEHVQDSPMSIDEPNQEHQLMYMEDGTYQMQAAETWDPSRDFPRDQHNYPPPETLDFQYSSYPREQSSSESKGDTSPELSPKGFEMDSPEARHTPFEFSSKQRHDNQHHREESPFPTSGGASLSSPSDDKSSTQDSESKKAGKPSSDKHPFDDWGEPMGLPSPPPPPAMTATDGDKSRAKQAEKKSRVSSKTTEAGLKKQQSPQTNNATPSSIVNGKSSNERDSKKDVDNKKESATKSYDKSGKKGAPPTASPKRVAPSSYASKSSPAKTLKRPESPLSSSDSRRSTTAAIKSLCPGSPVYVDLSYIPHHGNPFYCDVDFFRTVRARYYVFSGTNPSKEVFNALMEAKQSWEDPDLEVTIIPTYDTDTLGYWFALNEDELAKHKIDLAPSASRCTINLQDHETSCSAYRLEF